MKNKLIINVKKGSFDSCQRELNDIKWTKKTINVGISY